MTLPIPTHSEAMVDGQGRPTIHWRRYLAQIEAQGNAQLASDVEAIARALGSPDGSVANIPPQAELVATLTGRNGIRLFGTLASGNVRFELDQLANTGVGAALVKITRDAYGRVEGTQSATTTDLPEGTNLYHTAQRVRDTLLTGLSTATNAVITAADSVIVAFGKLQAQVSGILANYVTTARTISTTAPLTGGGDLSANRTLGISAATSGAAGSMSAADKAKLDGIEAGATATIDSIADGDTTHPPSRNAVFDALAGKEPTIAAGTPAEFWRGDKAWSNWLDGDLRIGQSAGLAGSGRELVVSVGSSTASLARLSLRGHRTGGGNLAALLFYNAAAADASMGGLAVATNGADDASLFLFSAKATGAAVVNVMAISTTEVRPWSDNSIALGSATSRWANAYAVNFRPGAGGVIWTSGAGTPEGVVTAPVGSLFTRTDGGAGTTLYVKQSGTGNTGWAAK